MHIGLVFRQFATCGGLFLTLCSGAPAAAGGGCAWAFQPFLTPWGGPVAAVLRCGARGRARGARRGAKQRGVRPAHRSMGWNGASMGCFGRSIPWNFRSKATRGTREARFPGRKASFFAQTGCRCVTFAAFRGAGRGRCGGFSPPTGGARRGASGGRGTKRARSGTKRGARVKKTKGMAAHCASMCAKLRPVRSVCPGGACHYFSELCIGRAGRGRRSGAQ